MGIVHINEIKGFKLREGVLIQGLPGIGLVGKIAVDYIVSELNLEKVAELYSDGLLLPIGNAGVFIDVRGVLKVPRYEFYMLSTKERDLLFLAGDVQPVGWSQYEVAERVLDFFISKGGAEVVGVCGTTAGREGEKAVYFAADSKDTAEWLEKLGFRRSIGGTITGACGLLPALASLKGLKGYVLMGTTMRAEPDPEASREVVKALCKIFGIKVSLEHLDTIIEEVRRKQAEAERLRKEYEERARREGLPGYYV